MWQCVHLKVGWCLGLILLINISQAGAQDGEPRVSVDSIKGIKVIGYKGKLKLHGDSKLDTVRIKVSNGEAFQRQIVDGWFELKSSGSADKEDWKTGVIESHDLEIRTRSIPLVVVWNEGDVSLTGWDSSVHVTHRKGKVRLENSKGLARLSLHEGELIVENFSGGITVDNYSAKLTLKKIEARMQVENFNGRMSVVESKGPFSLKTVDGKNTIDQLNGDLEFNNHKGEIYFVQSEGSVRGVSRAGNVEGVLKGPVEVVLKGESPKLNLHLPKGQGARVDVGTAKGNISSGLAIKVEKHENLKLVRGQVKGNTQAVVYVRLQEGEIRIR